VIKLAKIFLEDATGTVRIVDKKSGGILITVIRKSDGAKKHNVLNNGTTAEDMAAEFQKNGFKIMSGVEFET
jgi:hypothetical protein